MRMRKRKLRRLLAEGRGYRDALREQICELENALDEERQIARELEAQRNELAIAADERAVSRPVAWMEAEQSESEWLAAESPPVADEQRRVAPGDTIWITDREGGLLRRAVVCKVELTPGGTLARLELRPE